MGLMPTLRLLCLVSRESLTHTHTHTHTHTSRAHAQSHASGFSQVALKWLVQQGYPYVTASPTLEYDREDLDLFDWNITATEMATLNSIKL
jgi:diketogulonate reductase-like aldo/keto reductase